MTDHVCLSSLDWGYLWQGPQEVMASLVRGGGRVLYVENTGIRRPRVSDWRRLVRRARDWGVRPAGTTAQGHPGVTVVSPLALPFPWSPLARRANRVLLAYRLPARAAALGLERPVVWSFLPTPLALDVMRAFHSTRSLSAYYCMQDFEQLTDSPAALRRAETELLAKVDVVFSGGRLLQQRLERLHPFVVQAPVTVAERFFAPPAGPPPGDLAGLPGPRIGYVGGFHRHFDLGLIERLIELMPEATFVFVGPQVEQQASSLRRPNVHLLGRREHRELPGYIDGFDVCLIPYRLSQFTQTVWPTKLHEYLARGKPVVATSLPEVTGLGYPPGLLRIADEAVGMAAAIRAALADPEGLAADRRAAAALHRSDVVIGRVSAALDAARVRLGR